MSIDLESTSSERKRVRITTRVDPTGNAVEFAVTTELRSDPDGWRPGAWDGTWNSEDGSVDALSPTIGAAGTLVVEEGNVYDLWVRWTAGDEDPVRRVVSLNVL